MEAQSSQRIRFAAMEQRDLLAEPDLEAARRARHADRLPAGQLSAAAPPTDPATTPLPNDPATTPLPIDPATTPLPNDPATTPLPVDPATTTPLPAGAPPPDPISTTPLSAGLPAADPPPPFPPPSPPPVAPRAAPAPLRGGPLALLRFMRSHGMLSIGYARMLARLARLKLRHRGRLRTDGLCFICPRVQLEIGRGATLSIGRWAWIGHGTKIRVHEGEVSIGAKTVMGQECTISAYQRVSIGRECIVADRVMMIDFDHGVVEVERPIRLQGIYKRDVRVAHNVWIGYGACILRGVSVGENSILGTSAVVTDDVPANAVAAGVPARVIRMREPPRSMRWE
jgi:acetyltransferase-like isoleucine patch superfamily enzyme